MKPFVPQLLPITEIDWKSLIPLISQANRSLARYDGVLEGVPNPEILLSPITTQEAVLSSKIEGTQATLGEVFKYEAGEKPEEESRVLDIMEIINYRRALQRAEKELLKRPFNLNLLLDLHAILLDSTRGKNKNPGKFRKTQNWIGKFGTPIEKADFVPPEPLRLMEYLSNWETYYHADRPDSLVQLSIVHAQFEIIHPFLDGNGRLGRILIPIFLYEKKLLSRPMFYLSEYLENHREEYIGLLRTLGQREGSWNQWIGFFLKALNEQACQNAKKARDIIDLYESLKIKFTNIIHSQYAVHLLDQMFSRPIFQSSVLKFPTVTSPSRQSVAMWLRLLLKEGILTVVREGSGRRPQVLALFELINMCEGKNVIRPS